MAAMQKPSDGICNEGALLEKAGHSASDVSAWLGAVPEIQKDFQSGSAACSKFWGVGEALRAQLPRKLARNPDEAAARSLRSSMASRAPGSSVQSAIVVSSESGKSRLNYFAAIWCFTRKSKPIATSALP